MGTGIGQRIKYCREQLGISQQELAERMGLKSKSTVCKIERGEDNLTTPIIERYANALNTTPEYLADWHPDNTEKQIRNQEFISLYQNVPEEIQEKVVNLLKSHQLDP